MKTIGPVIYTGVNGHYYGKCDYCKFCKRVPRTCAEEDNSYECDYYENNNSLEDEFRLIRTPEWCPYLHDRISHYKEMNIKSKQINTDQ